MYFNKKSFSVLLICAGVIPCVQGAAIVDATGTTPGSVTTIGAALAGTDSEIIVKNTGVYHESVLITRDVNLHGEDPSDRPIIAMQALASQPVLGPGDGIYIGGTTGGSGNLDITFKDFIVIPDTTSGPTDDAFSVSANAGGVLNLTMDNVLCAPNNGADNPLATSVWDDPDLNAAGITKIPDDGIYLMDEQFSGFDGDVVVNLTDVVFIGVGGDAFVLYPGDNGSASLTCSGLGASYAGRYAAQINDENPISFTGTQNHPSFVARKNGTGPLIFQGGVVTIDNMISVGNNDTGLRVDPDTIGTLNLSNSLFANNFFQGTVMMFAPTTAKTWEVSNCTYFNNDSGGNNLPGIEVTSAVDANLTLNVTDCVFAGTDSEAITNSGTAVVTANNCAFVTAGTYALPGANTGVTENNSINDDPLFASVDTDPIVNDSFDVTAPAYATASSTSGELNGWGDGPGAAVTGWSLY